MVWINKVNKVVIDDWSEQVKTFWLKKLLTFVVLCSEYSRVHKLVDKTSWSFCTSAEKAGVGQVPAPLDGTVLGGLHARDDPARLLGRDVVHCLLVTTSSKRTEREVSYAKKDIVIILIDIVQEFLKYDLEMYLLIYQSIWLLK